MLIRVDTLDILKLYLHLFGNLERFCITENAKPILRVLELHEPLACVLLVDMIWIRNLSLLTVSLKLSGVVHLVP